MWCQLKSQALGGKKQGRGWEESNKLAVMPGDPQTVSADTNYLFYHVQAPVVMDLSPGPGLAHMAWRVQQVSGNPPWQCCFCVRAPGQMVPGWAGTPGRAGFPR
ncbi:hypothetical protein PAMP_002704 [Pampus punctatissimus]